MLRELAVIRVTIILLPAGQTGGVTSGSTASKNGENRIGEIFVAREFQGPRKYARGTAKISSNITVQRMRLDLSSKTSHPKHMRRPFRMWLVLPTDRFSPNCNPRI